MSNFYTVSREWLIMARNKGELNNCIDNYNWQANIHVYEHRLVLSNDITKRKVKWSMVNWTRKLWSSNEVG